MTAPTPVREPDRLSAGTTWQWRRDDLTDYPANAGFTLAYIFALYGATPFAINGAQVTADGSSFVIEVAATTTAAILPGLWKWAARITDGSGVVTEVDRGDMRVLPSLSTGDPRTHARRVLDLIEATIEGRASRSDLRYEIMVNGSMRRLDSFAPTELMNMRNAYRAEVKAEEERDRVAQRRGGRRRVFSRFTRPNGYVPPFGWPPLR